jgi:hypothetical protein
MPWASNNWEKSLPILAERGYLIPAINTDTVSYTSCAERLASSIRQWHPDANITIMTNDHCDQSLFTHVVNLPFGDQQGFNNDWQCFAASPYRQTVKLEADMLCTSPINHWWTMFEHRDVVISKGSRTFYNEMATSRYYRKLFDLNHLPDVYNAITYWRLSATAQEFFAVVRDIFQNWSQWQTLLKFPDQVATTDVVYAMAAQVLGPELVTLPDNLAPTIVHMKRHVQPVHSDNWTQELVWEHTDPGLRINTVAQTGMFHYHIKDWLADDSSNN